MGAKCKIKCSSIGIIFVLIGCGSTLSFEYGSNGQNRPFNGNLMDFFSKMFQKHSQNDRLPLPKVIQSVNQIQDISHWGPYQRPVQQSDYERNFYNFGVQKDAVYSDEGTDYSSLDFSCQEPSIQHNDPCGEAETEYTADQTVDCNDNKYGIRWKGSPPEQANVEIEEVVLKGGQAQWSKDGGESETTNYDEIAPTGTPSLNGLTKIDIHNCYPQEPQGRGHEANGSQTKTTGNEYFVLVIKKDHLLGNARSLNTTATSIDAIIGASLQPTNIPKNATAHDNSQSFNESSSQSPSVDRAIPMMTAANSQTAINPTRVPLSSAENPTSTTTITPDDESVSQSTDVPTKITILENPKMSSSNTKPAVNAQPKFHPTQIPLSSTKTPGTISKIRPDEVVSQPIDRPPKIILTHKPAIQNSNTLESNSLSKKFNPYAKSPITTVIPTNYSSETTAIPAREDSQPSVPPSSTPVNNTRPIVNHATPFAPTTVEAYDPQSVDPPDNSKTAQVAMVRPENTPKSPEISSAPSPNEKNPELIVNYTNFTEAPITMGFPADSNSKTKEPSWKSNINYDSVTPRVGDYAVKITTTIVNILSPVMGSSNPTFLGSKPTVGKARPTEEDTKTVYGAKIDPTSGTATIVNDMSDDETRPHPTSLNDSNSVVGNTELPRQDSTPVYTSKSDLQPKTKDQPPVVTSSKPTSFGSNELSDSMRTITKPTEEDATTPRSRMPPPLTSSKSTYFDSSDLSESEPAVGKTKPTEEDAQPFVAPKADPQLKTAVNDMPLASKPQPKSIGSTHLNDLTTIVEKTTSTPIFLMENNSKSRILNDHRLLIPDEKRPIQSNENLQNMVNSQSTEIPLNNNFVPEKETFPSNDGKSLEEVSLPNLTNTETFTIASNSKSSNEIRPLIKENTDKTKPTLPQTAKDGKKHLKTTPTVIEPEFAVTTSKELPKTLKPTLAAKDNSQSTILNSSPIQFTSDTRSDESNAGADFVAAVTDSQSHDSTSNSNLLANDRETLVTTTNPSLVAWPHPEFKDSETRNSTENYKIGTTSHEYTSDAAAVTPTESQLGHTSAHNIHDIAHRIKGLQDLVHKLMSTVSSPVTSNVVLSPKSIQNPINIQNTTVSNSDSVEHPQGSETTPTVDDSKGTSNVTLPKTVSLSEGLQSDFDSTPIVSAKNPRLNDNEPTIETTPYSIVTAANSESATLNSNPKSRKDNGRSSANESSASVISTTPTVVLSSQSSRPDPKLLMNLTPTSSDDQSAVKKDSLSIAGIINSKSIELPPQPDSTVNGSTIFLKDPTIVDKDKLLGVSRSDNREPSSLESSTSHSFNKTATVNDDVENDDGSILSRNPLAMNLNSNAANGVKYEIPTTTEANSSRSAEVAKSENKATDKSNGRSLNGAPPPKDLSNNALQSTNVSKYDVPTIGGRASSRSPDATLNEKKASDNGRSLIEIPQPIEEAKDDMSTIDRRAGSRSLDATLNEKKASDNGRSLIGSPPPKDLSNNALQSTNGSRDEVPTIVGRASSRSPDATLNEKKASHNGKSLKRDPPATNLRDNAFHLTNGIRDEVPINTGANNSPSSDPKPHPANAAEDAGGSHSTLKTPDIENLEDYKNNSQSPVNDPVETLSSSPVDPRVSMADEKVVNSNNISTPVTFTENSYDASSFTSTYSPALASTEETKKSPSKSKSIHKFLSFISWMRSKKNAGNTTENVATQLTESFDPFEEITEISDKILPMIDKEILPENLANWFLGFRSAEDDDSVNTSTVNESQSSEVLHTSSEFNDLYHSFLEAVIHNINNVSSIVNASEPIGTPFSWWSSFKEVDEPQNNTTKKSSSTDILETSSQSATNLDRGLMEGAIHKVNDALPIVNDSNKLRGYKNILKGHHIVNGSSSKMSIEASSPSTFYSGTIHKVDDGSRKVENADQSKEQTSWFSKFWDFGNMVQSNSSSIVNGTQAVDVIEVSTKDTSSIGNRTEVSLTAKSTLESTSFWPPNNATSNTTKGDMVSSKSPEFHQNSTVNTAVEKEPDDVDDDDVEIIFRRPKPKWLSLLAGIQEAQKASTPNANGTKQHFDMRSVGKPDDTIAKQRTFSHFHGSDFEVWSGEHK